MRALRPMEEQSGLVPAPKRRREACHGCQEAVSLAAHDMKTPLAVLNGYLELLLSERLGLLNDRQREILLQMQASGARLEQVVEDSLSFSALKAGNFRPEFALGRFEDCIAEVAAFWGPCFIKRGIRFRVVNGQPLPPFRFDSHKTQRVLSNLLENALRFTPMRGEVTLSTEPFYIERRRRKQLPLVERRMSDNSSPNSVRIVVADTGSGIAPEHHRDIFNAYVRLGQTDEHSSGTGLGLAIAKNLVTALRGDIWVESEIGNGSKFVVVLPIKPD